MSSPPENRVTRLAYSPAEAAAALGVSVDYLMKHIADELPWVRRGRRRFVALAALEKWLEQSAYKVLEERR